MTSSTAGDAVYVTGRGEPAGAGAVNAIADLAAAGYDPVEDGENFIVVTAPAGAETKLVDVKEIRDKYAPRPERKTGHPRFTTPQALATYINGHAGDGTILFGNINTSEVIVVLNGHEPNTDDAGWGDHRATFTAKHTAEWLRWTGLDTRWLPQLDFAEHIEASFPEVVNPDAATMLEIAQTFRATKGVDFKSDQLLTSGETHLVYEETVSAKAGQRGEFDVPDLITLRMAPYEGGEQVEVTARLRFRISDDGKLSIAYKLIRPENVVREAFDALTSTITQQTGRPVLDGTPA